MSGDDGGGISRNFEVCLAEVWRGEKFFFFLLIGLVFEVLGGWV